MANVNSLNVKRLFSAAGIVLLFMMTPALGLVRIWPLPSAITDGLTLFCVGLLFGVLLVPKRTLGFRYNSAIFIFLGLTATLVASVVLNSFTYEAAWRWYLIAFIVCVMALVAASELKALNPKRFNNVVSFTLWLGSFVFGIVSLLEYYGAVAAFLVLAPPETGRLEGVWGQANLTTTTTWLGILAGAVFFSEKRRRGWWYTSVVVFGWVLACAASRMSWLMVVGLLCLIFVSHFPRFRDRESANAGRLLGWAVALIVVLLFVFPAVNQFIREGLVAFGLLEPSPVTSLVKRDVFNNSARLTELSKVVSGVSSFSWIQWLFGIGPGNYPAFSYRVDMTLTPEGLHAGTWLHSHNIFTMIFIEFGFVGLAALVGFVVAVALAALKVPMTLPRFFSVGAIGLLFIHSNLEFPLWNLWFLVLLCLFLTNLFEVRELKGDSVWLNPVVGLCGALMIAALILNVGYQYFRITDVALSSERDRQDYQSLALLANDSLMGPYAVLRKYRDFGPESSNIDWQLSEVRKMKAWQPKDLVILREFSLLVLKRDIPAACQVAKRSAYRYPRSAPIMLEHSLLVDDLSPAQIAEIANCIEDGLAPRGETIWSMQEKNRAKTSN